MLSCASCWFWADLHQFKAAALPLPVSSTSVGTQCGSPQPEPASQTPKPAPHPCHCCTQSGELMGSPLPAAVQNQLASGPPKRNVFLRYIGHCDANSAQTDGNMNLEGGNAGMQLGQAVGGCPGWAHVEQRHRSGFPGGRGAHRGRLCREGQTQSWCLSSQPNPCLQHCIPRQPPGK